MERSQSMSSAPGKLPVDNRGTIRGILFDKDGTLFDFCASWIPAYRRSAERCAELAAGVDAVSLLATAGYDAARSLRRRNGRSQGISSKRVECVIS